MDTYAVFYVLWQRVHECVEHVRERVDQGRRAHLVVPVFLWEACPHSLDDVVDNVNDVGLGFRGLERIHRFHELLADAFVQVLVADDER